MKIKCWFNRLTAWIGVVIFASSPLWVKGESFLEDASGLIAYWPINSTSKVSESGDTANYEDQSGNGHQLIVSKSHVSYQPDPTACDGEYANLDGSGSFLKSSDALPLNGADGLTFFFRIRMSDSASLAEIFEISPDYNKNSGAITVSASKVNGKWYLDVSEKVGAGYALARSAEPLDGTRWQNVVVVFTKNTCPRCFTVYVNGESREMTPDAKHRQPTTSQAYKTDVVYIGGRNGAGTSSFDLDEFGAYGRALDAEEVTDLTDNIAGTGGLLYVEAVGASKGGTATPGIGINAGYAEGQSVSFSLVGVEGTKSVWSLFTYDAETRTWVLNKRGYGHCGTFVHTGAKMRLRWEDEMAPICRWTFEDGTGKNSGSIGSTGDLDLHGSASATDRYLAIPGEAAACASTKSSLPLSSATGVSIAFWLRSPVFRAGNNLFELSQNYTTLDGSLQTLYDSTTHQWGGSMHKGNYSVVVHNQSADDDVLMDNEWHYATVVFRKAKSPNVDLYIDGSKQAMTADPKWKMDTTIFDFANAELWLCAREAVNTQKADFDNVSVYTWALTEGEADILNFNECGEKGRPAVLSAGTDSLVVTAKRAVPTGDLPIPEFGKVCSCAAGETLSFDFTGGSYVVEGREGAFSLGRWTLYRFVDGKWSRYLTSTEQLVEFVHPGGQVKLELNFTAPGLMILLR